MVEETKARGYCPICETDDVVPHGGHLWLAFCKRCNTLRLGRILSIVQLLVVPVVAVAFGAWVSYLMQRAAADFSLKSAQQLETVEQNATQRNGAIGARLRMMEINREHARGCLEDDCDAFNLSKVYELTNAIDEFGYHLLGSSEANNWHTEFTEDFYYKPFEFEGMSTIFYLHFVRTACIADANGGEAKFWSEFSDCEQFEGATALRDEPAEVTLRRFFNCVDKAAPTLGCLNSPDPHAADAGDKEHFNAYIQRLNPPDHEQF